MADKAIRVVNTEKASAQYYVDVLGVVLKRLRWTNVAGGPPAAGTDVVWSEDPVRKPRLLALPHGCRTNRFFAMVRVCRKVCLAILLDACMRLHPERFATLAPATWWVGRAAVGWEEQLEAHKQHDAAAAASSSGGGGGKLGGGAFGAYIVKPDNGCQGAGIELVRGHAELKALLARADGPERAVVQTYLPNPLLVDGLKFDLRLYVILTCGSPLQAFLSTRGVARFASHKWKPLDESNQGDMMMHLSNSSINQVNTGVTNKWELPRLWAKLASDGADVDALWVSIHELVALTLAAMQPTVAHAYSNAFAVGGFAPRRSKAAAAAPAARRPGGEVLAAAPAGETEKENGNRTSGGGGGGGGTIVDVSGASSKREAPPPPPPQAQAPSTSAGIPREHTSGGIPDVSAEAGAQARRCFQILGFDVMLDADLKPVLLEVNHSPSMALAGNEADEVDAKCSVISAALRLGTADEHTEALCRECEVGPLHTIARPLCALEPVRALFEANATSRSSQQWTMNAAAFERLLQPALAALSSGGGDGGAAAPAPAAAALEPRVLFADACATRADVGSGWDAPAAGQMTLWAFTEAMLRVAEAAATEAERAGGVGLAAPLARVVAAMR